MSLNKYNQKRNFEKSPEPTGGKPDGSTHMFVVQKHHASHLHYDFRLEMEGVLKSWAVPKGPSMNPDDKRLAMMVEDHPWDYRNFEGIIPEGYGAGTVIVWDHGSYQPLKKLKNKKLNDKELLHQLYKGALSFKLNGKKLKGEFSLVKTKGRGDNAWLLIKKKDKYASLKDITKKDKSVLSNKDLDQVKLTSDNIWESHKAAVTKTTVTKDNVDDSLMQQLSKGIKSAFPDKVNPMLCTLVKDFSFTETYLYEVKWDGYRVICKIEKGKVALSSRNGVNYTKQYDRVTEACKKLGKDMVLDGEIVLLNDEGKPDFGGLQNYKTKGNLVYYVFDLLWLDGYDLTSLKLEDRKNILQQIITGDDIIKFSDSFEDGKSLFELIRNTGLEGVVAKKRASTYQQNKRNNNWLKIPVEKQQEFVIGGYTESDSSSPFRSLIFGYYNKNKLIYQGHAGGGFTEKQKKEILKKLKSIEIKKNPFSTRVEATTTIHYVKPKLVAIIKFADYTGRGKIRKPAIFMGFRDDKDPGSVIYEKSKIIKEPKKTIILAKSDQQIAETEEKKVKNKTARSADSNWKYIDNENITSKETFLIEGKRVEITNVEKPVWNNIPKASLIRYYHSVAPFILPHLNDRTQSLHVKNNGAQKPGFYIKDMEGRQPEFASVFTIDRKHKKKDKADKINYLLCNNEATLLYIINLGCIDINPSTSRINDYFHPDYIIIDLDPSDNDFKKVVITTKAAKQVFDKYGITAFPKTSGKTGMHLYIPCNGFSFQECRSIAEFICEEIHQLVPGITTTNIAVDKRGDKLYIDPNQNDEADTVAAPYSVRPAYHPTVSTPLAWKEINEKLDFKKFNIDTILERINKKGELFKDVLNTNIAKKNTKQLKKLLLRC